MLDPDAHQILEHGRFDTVHLVYINLSTVQWGAGLLHTLLALVVWKFSDGLLKIGSETQ